MNLEFDKVIVGNSLTALVNAYYRGLPIIVHGRPQYFFFDKIGSRTKSQLWREYAFQLTMAGLMPFGDNVKELYSNDEGWEIVTKNGKRHYVKCGTSHPCAPSIRKGEPPFDHSAYEIIDWFTVHSGRVHQHEELFFSHSAVHRIIFYPTKRFFAHDKFKDLVAISYAWEDQKENEEYQEWSVRLSVLQKMKDAGIKGSKNGIRPSGTQKYLALNIENEKRVVRPHYVGEDQDIALTLAAHRPYVGSNLMLNKKAEEMINQWGDPLG